MSRNNSPARVSLGAADVLGIAFIVLKLCGVINWSWWWVLAPIWAPFGIWLLIFVIALVVEVYESR